MIKITNLSKTRGNFPRVYCGRGSALGNPFVLGRDGNRDSVCDQYEKYFEYNTLDKANTPFWDQLFKIANHAQNGDVYLECFCAPQRCHCETIKAYVEEHMLY